MTRNASRPSEPAENGRPPLLSTDVAPPAGRRTVLVVDDEPGMRYVTRRVLEPEFEVKEASSAEEALQMLEQTQFNIALVDVRLPGLSGLDLLTSLKIVRPSTDVIVMTGSTDIDEALEISIRRKAFFFLRKPFPMTILETLVQRVAETQELEERLVQYARDLERGLESARIFQRRMLPPTPWQGRRVEIASNYQASERLSGDFFDYWSLPGGGTALLIADVMGHGPPSAMITGIVKSQVRSLATDLTEPGPVLTALEEELQRIELRSFLTAFLIFDHPDEERISYAGAGHVPAYLLAPGEGAPSSRLTTLDSTGLPVNTGLPITERETRTMRRVPGSRLLLYSDGYPEARNDRDVAFDEEEIVPVDPSGRSPKKAGDLSGKAAPRPVHGADSPFARAVVSALHASGATMGIGILEERWREHVGAKVPDDDRAVVLAWFV